MSIVQNGYLGQALQFDELAVGVAAVGFTLADYSSDFEAVQFVSDQPVRLRYDGDGDPTATSGMPLQAGVVYTLLGFSNIGRAKFIRDTTATGDATVAATFLTGA